MQRILIGCYNKSVILTYIGIVIALIGISSTENIKVSIICLILAGICDLFDGPVARRCKNRTELDKKFGIQIDSLADVIISLALPFTIVSTICKNYNTNLIITITILSTYVTAGIIRLAWFNINTSVDKKTEYYRGLPVTYIAIILPISYTLFNGLAQLNNILLGIMLVTAFLFICNIKVKKPTGKWYIVFVIIAIIVIVVNILSI